MLVLTRRAGESVRIGSEIRVTILSATGGQVRIGIDAPARITVHREEVFDRIVAANVEAASIGVVDLERWQVAAPTKDSPREEEEGE